MPRLPGVLRAQMDVIEILQELKKGTTMLRCKGRKEPLRKYFCVKLETLEIQQFSIAKKSSQPESQPEEYGMILIKRRESSVSLYRHSKCGRN